jgi:hypothetical protein
MNFTLPVGAQGQKISSVLLPIMANKKIADRYQMAQ